MARAVVLLSGGLDSTTTATQATRDGHDVYALTVQYGQRHARELEAAAAVAKHLDVTEHTVLNVDLSVFGGSALTDEAVEVPVDRAESDMGHGIPATYVPARNTVLLSLALAYAEARDAALIYIGANAVDYSGYPDCRPEFINQFERLANLGTKRGVEAANGNGDDQAKGFRVIAPLISLTKAEIVQLATDIEAPLALTWSCYQGGAQPCGRCDSCQLRKKGFDEAGVKDPAQPA